MAISKKIHPLFKTISLNPETESFLGQFRYREIIRPRNLSHRRMLLVRRYVHTPLTTIGNDSYEVGTHPPGSGLGTNIAQINRRPIRD